MFVEVHRFGKESIHSSALRRTGIVFSKGCAASLLSDQLQETHFQRFHCALDQCNAFMGEKTGCIESAELLVLHRLPSAPVTHEHVVEVHGGAVHQ